MLWPRIDLIVAGWFYNPRSGFFFSEQPVLVYLHDTAYYGARVLGALLALGALIALIARREIFGIAGKGWLFLLLALLIAPGLVGNAALKDRLGRARPMR